MFQIPNPKQFKKVTLLLIIGFTLFPVVTLAAVLYLDPSNGEYYQGDTFMVEIRLDTEEESINVVEAN